MAKRNRPKNPRKHSVVRQIVKDGIRLPEEEQLITANPRAVQTKPGKQERAKRRKKRLDQQQLSGSFGIDMVPPGMTKLR